MSTRLFQTVCLGVMLALASGTASAQAQAKVPASASTSTLGPMTPVDFINVPRLSAPQLSPDGRQVLYVRSDADWKQNKRITHIWRVQVDGSDSVRMTNGVDGEDAPRWSPDGRRIAFVAKRPRADKDAADKDGAQLFVMPASGGEAMALTTQDAAVSEPAWSPDGRYLYFLMAEPKTAEEKAREKAKDDVYALDENYKHRRLWRVSVDSRAGGSGVSGSGVEGRGVEGRGVQAVTPGDASILEYSLSADGARLVLHRAPTPLYGDAWQSDVWVAAADGSQPVRITTNDVAESGGELSPDNRQVLFLSQANARQETYYNSKLFVAPAAGGAVNTLTATLPYEIERAQWSKDGRAIWFVANAGVHSELFRIDATGGAPAPITNGDHALLDWQYVPGAGRHVFVRARAIDPGDVWTLADAASAAALTPVTKVLADLGQRFALPRQERVSWKGADGRAVEGLLTYPTGDTAGRRYPLIALTHGGPMASDKFGYGGWASPLAVLAGRGYAVLQPNYRGSTGYGDDFLRDMVGSYFKNAHLDVMAGVDHLIAIGLADPDRLVAMGWSAGGHMTNKLMTFTDRFKAASSGAGAANWVSMYGQSDVRTYRTPWFGGTPWQKDAPIDVYWNHSPLKFAANARTPTLFLVGEMDVRVPMPQSVEMHRALKSHGVPTKLYAAPREPHSWQELRHQLFKINVELEWFERYVTQRPYTRQPAPPDATPGAPLP